MGGKTLAIVLGLAAFAMTNVPSNGTEPLKLSIGQAHARPKCESSIADYLARLSIAEDDIAKVSVFSVKPTTGKLLGYRAWVALKSCRGSLVVNLTPLCRVRDTYTRGECQFDNVARH